MGPNNMITTKRFGPYNAIVVDHAINECSIIFHNQMARSTLSKSTSTIAGNTTQTSSSSALSSSTHHQSKAYDPIRYVQLCLLSCVTSRLLCSPSLHLPFASSSAPQDKRYNFKPRSNHHEALSYHRCCLLHLPLVGHCCCNYYYYYEYQRRSHSWLGSRCTQTGPHGNLPQNWQWRVPLQDGGGTGCSSAFGPQRVAAR